MIYIFLRDHNPEFIDILMQEDIMEIPKNKNISSSQAIKGQFSILMKGTI